MRIDAFSPLKVYCLHISPLKICTVWSSIVERKIQISSWFMSLSMEFIGTQKKVEPSSSHCFHTKRGFRTWEQYGFVVFFLWLPSATVSFYILYIPGTLGLPLRSEVWKLVWNRGANVPQVWSLIRLDPSWSILWCVIYRYIIYMDDTLCTLS